MNLQAHCHTEESVGKYDTSGPNSAKTCKPTLQHHVDPGTVLIIMRVLSLRLPCAGGGRLLSLLNSGLQLLPDLRGFAGWRSIFPTTCQKIYIHIYIYIHTHLYI